MYLLTTCGHGTKIAPELPNANIAFSERFLDINWHAEILINARLVKAGDFLRAISTLTIGGRSVKMPDNPGLATVRKQL